MDQNKPTPNSNLIQQHMQNGGFTPAAHIQSTGSMNIINNSVGQNFPVNFIPRNVPGMFPGVGVPPPSVNAAHPNVTGPPRAGMPLGGGPLQPSMPGQAAIQQIAGQPMASQAQAQMQAAAQGSSQLSVKLSDLIQMLKPDVPPESHGQLDELQRNFKESRMNRDALVRALIQLVGKEKVMNAAKNSQRAPVISPAAASSALSRNPSSSPQPPGQQPMGSTSSPQPLPNTSHMAVPRPSPPQAGAVPNPALLGMGKGKMAPPPQGAMGQMGRPNTLVQSPALNQLGQPQGLAPSITPAPGPSVPMMGPMAGQMGPGGMPMSSPSPMPNSRGPGPPQTARANSMHMGMQQPGRPGVMPGMPGPGQGGPVSMKRPFPPEALNNVSAMKRPRPPNQPGGPMMPSGPFGGQMPGGPSMAASNPMMGGPMMQGPRPGPSGAGRGRPPRGDDDDRVDARESLDLVRMGNVNEQEESEAAVRDVELLVGSGAEDGRLIPDNEPPMINILPLRERMVQIASKFDIKEIPDEATEFLSLALQDRIRDLLQRLVAISHRRLDVHKENHNVETTAEPKKLLQAIEKKMREEKERREAEERAREAAAAKEDKGKGKDKEERSKEKDKERTKKLEAEKNKQTVTNINETALSAVGSIRFKPRGAPGPFGRGAPARIGAPGAGRGAMAGIPVHGPTGMMQHQRQPMQQPQQPFKAPNPMAPAARPPPQKDRSILLRDVVFLLEREHQMRKSKLLYRLYLKM